MKTAVIYARYSSDNQTEQSIEGQLRVCQDYAQRNDMLILNTYIDRAMTGTNDNRPDFQQMIKDSEKKDFQYILVYKTDRFSRDKYTLATYKKKLKDNGVKLLSATENIPDTPEGIILESLIEGMAEYYSAELSQKIKRGMKETRLKGLYQGGGLPYGYKVEDRKIVLNELEYPHVQFMFNQYAKGFRVKHIIETLTSQGVLNKGKPFEENIVYRILKNEKYVGMYKKDNEIVDNMYPPIISREIFDKVQSAFKSNQYVKYSNTTTYLLKNKLKCGYCGMPISSECGTLKNGTTIHYYRCRNKKRFKGDCDNPTIRKEFLEKVIIDEIIKELQKPKNLNTIINKLLQIQNNNSNHNSMLDMFKKEKSQVEKQLNNIVKAIENGIINRTTNQRMKELEEKVDELEKQILIEQNKQAVQITENDIRKFYVDALKKEPLSLINNLVNKVIVFKDKLEIVLNSPLKRSPDTNQGFSFLYKDSQIKYMLPNKSIAKLRDIKVEIYV